MWLIVKKIINRKRPIDHSDADTGSQGFKIMINILKGFQENGWRNG